MLKLKKYFEKMITKPSMKFFLNLFQFKGMQSLQQINKDNFSHFLKSKTFKVKVTESTFIKPSHFVFI